MTQPRENLPACPHCNAIRMPGAPMCTQCWAVFDDRLDPVSGTSAGVGATPPVMATDSRFAWNANPSSAQPMAISTAGIPTQAGPDAAPPGAPPGRRPIGGSAPLPPPIDERKLMRIVALVVVALLLVGVGGGYFWYRSSKTNDKALVADLFKNARPPGWLPAFPDFGVGAVGVPETPGDAQRFMATLNPQVRHANDSIFALEKLLTQWAKGKASDDAVRAAVSSFLTELKPFDLLSAPESLARGASKLSRAASDYSSALNALLDWLDAHNRSARTTYGLQIGDANVHWDEALIALYRGSGLSQPALPHPQVDG